MQGTLSLGLKTTSPMIEGIDIKNLRTGEFLQFIRDVLAIVRASEPATSVLQERLTSLQQSEEALAGLFTNYRSSNATAQMQKLDARRDRAVRGLTYVLKGLTLHPHEDISRQALLLYEHLKNHGAAAIAQENYNSETALIRIMLGSWSTQPELSAAVDALQLGAWTTELAQANDSFDELSLLRTREGAAKSPVTMKEQRMDAGRHYFALRDTVNAHYTISGGAEPFVSLESRLNALIGQYKMLLAVRKGKAQARERRHKTQEPPEETGS